MTESYKTFILNYLNDEQKRRFNSYLQWESDLSKLYYELLEIDVTEEVCNVIIPELDSSIIQEANHKTAEYYKMGLAQNEVEQKLFDEGYHPGIISNAIENHVDEVSGANLEKKKIEKNKSWSYIRLILLIILGISQLGRFPVWGIIIMIFAIVSFVVQISQAD